MSYKFVVVKLSLNHHFARQAKLLDLSALHRKRGESAGNLTLVEAQIEGGWEYLKTQGGVQVPTGLEG